VTLTPAASPVTLAGRVYYDADADGVQDAGEPGIPGSTIQVVWHGPDGVLGGTDDQTFTTTTDDAGDWSLPNLPAGNFTVTATATYDLDGDPADGSTFRELAAGESATDVDFGYRGDATIGDRVWYDVDGDGVQDASAADGFEPGIAGATVTLTFGGADGDL